MANWQEALKKGGQAFHGEPGKPADASVNLHEGHYVAYAANNSINAGWDENLSSAGATSAYFRKHGVDPDTGWRSQWMVAAPNAEELHSLTPGATSDAKRKKRMRTNTGVGTSHSIQRPVCACRRCRTRRAKHTPRVVESTLVTISQSTIAGWKMRLRWGLASAGLLLLAGVGMLWDSGPLAPLLFRPTAIVTIEPTRLESQARLSITAVTGTSNTAKHEVAARFVSAISPASEAFGQASGVTHVPAVAAGGTLTFYNAATYPQTIAADTVLTGADGVQVLTDAAAPIPAGDPPLFGVVTVNAHAVLVGSRGNIAALDIDGLCCVAGVAVKNTAGLSGGQDAQTYTTVRQADVDGLARPLIDTLTQDAQAGIRVQLRPQEWMVTIPACSNAVNADHPAGSRATQVTVTVAVTCRTEVYDQQAALRLAASSFTQETATTLGTNYALVGRVMTTLVSVIVTDPKRGTLTLSIEAEGVWVYRWSPKHLGALAKRIAGTQKQEALVLLLREAGVQAASIHLSGGEGTTLPAGPSQILITVAGERTAEEHRCSRSAWGKLGPGSLRLFL